MFPEISLGPFLIPAGGAGYLFGLLAALIPLIIHLSRSRRTKKMRFSTTRFFTEQFLRSYRMSRLREVLLLACRMALFAFLAMALTGILFAPKGKASAALSGSGPRTVVIVLDDSASMDYRENGVPVFRRAQEAAATLLAGLSPRDRASVVLAGWRAGGPEVLFPEPTSEFDEVRRAVEKAKPSALGTDLSGAIARADEIASGGREEGRSANVYVISDLQETGWDLPSSSTARSGSSEVNYVFVGVRPRTQVVNRAVTAVRYAATRPRVGVPFAVRPLLALGADDGKDVNVRLFLDGARVGEQKIERLPGGKWASPRFYHTFTEGGWHAGHVEIDDDNLLADNRRYFAIEVPETTQTVSVLAVNGAPSSIAHQDELFFLRLALTAAPEGQKAPFEIRSIAPAELAAVDVSTYPLVVLANVERLTEAAVEKLEKFVDEGGKLLVFLGDKVNPAFYNRMLAGANRLHRGLLPGTIKGLKEEEVGFIGAINYEHRALAAFQEPRLGSLLGPSLTFKALRVEAPVPSVLMKASSGAPLLCEKAFGKGKVLLFASTCDRDWSDFPIKPGFLLWSRFLAEYLTQTPLSLQAGHRTGEVVRLTPPAEEKGNLWVRKPDGSKVAAPRATDGSADFEFTDTQAPGVYTVLRSDQETRIGMFAINLDTYESDLAYLDEEQPGEGPGERAKEVVAALKARLGQPPSLSYVDAVDSPGELAEGGGGGRRRLWFGLLLLVLAIGVFEPWLANKISARLFGRVAKPVLATPGGPAARMVERPASVAEGAVR